MAWTNDCTACMGCGIGSDHKPCDCLAGAALLRLHPQKAYLLLDGWEGRTKQLVRVTDATPKRYRIRADSRIRLAGRSRYLEPGHTALVPKTAIKFPESV